MWQKYITTYSRDEALGKFVWENLGLNRLDFDSQCKVLLDIKGRQIRFVIMTRWDFGFRHYVEWELQTYQDLLTKRMKREAAKIKKEIENKIEIIEEDFKIEHYDGSSLERKCFYDVVISKEAYNNIMVLLKIEGLDIKS
ncbi:MAG: hypothetical protein J5691_00730 [Bacilli bacterium]|nr:hypothetical protein [Bacilli bacterium]